ncbi:hypothetical protein F5X98DRAFT_357734 [Xylaria grammica]|nr:hypothetical protein F5X98DRAFT_357734 [Xylaria grammica]
MRSIKYYDWVLNLTTTTASPASVTFAMLRIPLKRLINSIAFLVQIYASLLRIDHFLQERGIDNYSQVPNSLNIGLENTTLTWPTSHSTSKFSLQHTSRRGYLTEQGIYPISTDC